MSVSNPVLKQLFDHETGTYTYLLFDAVTKEGIIIDTVREQFDRDLKLVKELGINLKYIFDTHVHADHVTAAGMLRKATRAKTAFGEPSGVACADILLNDGEELQFGDYTIKVISTPGHTDACTSFYVQGMLFTGDSLLIRGCGRTDFQQGSPAKMFDSITQKLYCFPDETLVYPGHDYKGQSVSTIGEEKTLNPRISQDQNLEDFAEIMNHLKLDPPRQLKEALPANLGCGFAPIQGHITGGNFSMNDLHEVMGNLTSEQVIVDIRTPQEFEQGHVPESLNLPLGVEGDAWENFRNHDKVYIYCRSGRRAQILFTFLSDQGFENIVPILSSGMPDWIAEGYPVSNS